MIAARLSARYCNWLHNNKVIEQWAFDDGVYDTSTFGKDGNGNFTDDYTRRSDARYWIPTMDEWLKSVYYDQNRYSEGQGGWWRYPNSSETPPLAGFPEDDGETNASLWVWFDGPFFPVGMYPDQESPWGLWDTSGGLTELSTGKIFGSEFFNWDEDVASWYDHIGLFYHGEIDWRPDLSTFGLRLGSTIPGPSVVMLFTVTFFITINRTKGMKK